MRVLPSFAVFKLKLKEDKSAFEKLLRKKIDGIKERLTRPDMEEVKEEFVNMVKRLSAGIPQQVKNEDEALEQYRLHN